MINNEIKTKLVNEGKQEAIKSIKHFLELLDLNKEAFNHLYNIQIKIENIKENEFAQYNFYDNIIILDIDKIIEIAAENEYNEKTKNIIIDTIAITIIHETIHANRTIMIEDTININNIREGKTSTELILASDNYLGNSLNLKEISTKLHNSRNFEEILTETISIIIDFSKNDTELNLNDVCNKILNSNAVYCIKVGANFIKNIGIDIIKWFLTSVYNDYYIDELELIFKDKYDKLISNFNNLYEEVLYKEKTSKSYQNIKSTRAINKIVNNRKK